MNEDQHKMFLALLYKFYPEILEMPQGDEREKKVGDFYDEVVQAGLDYLLSVSMFMDSMEGKE